MNKLNEFRLSQIEMLKGKPASELATATTVNLTRMQGGVQSNVIPPQITVTYDMRMAIDVDHAKWEAQILKWCEEAGGGIEMKFLVRQPAVEPTKLDGTNPYWLAFKAAIDELGEAVTPTIMPGATDIRFVRALGIPSFGFMPINNTPVLLHDHDEYLGVDIYLRGIEIYERIFQKVSAVP